MAETKVPAKKAPAKKAPAKKAPAKKAIVTPVVPIVEVEVVPVVEVAEAVAIVEDVKKGPKMDLVYKNPKECGNCTYKYNSPSCHSCVKFKR